MYGWQPGLQSCHDWHFGPAGSTWKATGWRGSFSPADTQKCQQGLTAFGLCSVAAIGRRTEGLWGEKLAGVLYFSLEMTGRASGFRRTSTVGKPGRAGFDWNRMLEQIKLLEGGGGEQEPSLSLLSPPLSAAAVLSGAHIVLLGIC